MKIGEKTSGHYLTTPNAAFSDNVASGWAALLQPIDKGFKLPSIIHTMNSVFDP